MPSIKPLPEFTIWLDKLDDAQVRGVIVARIKRLALGLMGDVEPVGEGISELRIHLGAGWRIYFTQRGKEVIVDGIVWHLSHHSHRPCAGSQSAK